MSSDAPASVASEASTTPLPRVRRWRLWLVRALVTVTALTILVATVDGGELSAAFSRVPTHLLPLAVLANLLVIALAALRWSLLLRGFGAHSTPPFDQLMRLQLEGLFYNTYVPGAVAGDVVRAMATRRHMVPDDAPAGLTAAGSVVFVERVLGLVGMIVLVAATFALRPFPGVQNVWLWSGVGLATGTVAVAGIAFGRRLSHLLPGMLRRFAASLPAPSAWTPFVLAVVCAIASHALLAAIGHVWIASLDTRVTLTDSLCLIPLATAATYFPLTIAGAGAVETAMVYLYQILGVARSDALAAALMMQLAKLLTAALGAITAWRRSP
jgi:glycosyltransferase 2 family protein